MRASRLALLALAFVVSEAVFDGQSLAITSHLVHIDDCTASVLNSRYILTAAHCMFPLVAAGRLSVNASEVRVRTDAGFRTGITGWYIAPGFNWVDRYATGAANDAAIVRLIDPLPSFATPIRWDSPIPVGSGSSVVFHGYGGTGTRVPTEGAREGRAKLVQCAAAYRSNGTLCAEGGGQSAICGGDSGGPVMTSGVQVGVASFGSCRGGISIWANTQRLRPWIRSVLAGQVQPTPPRTSKRQPNESVDQFIARDSADAIAWVRYLEAARIEQGLSARDIPSPMAIRPIVPRTPVAAAPSAFDLIRQQQGQQTRN